MWGHGLRRVCLRVWRGVRECVRGRVRVGVRVRVRVRAGRRRAVAAMMAVHAVRAVLCHGGYGRTPVRCRQMGVVYLTVGDVILRCDRLGLCGHGVVRGHGLGGVGRGAKGRVALVGGVVVLRRVAGGVLTGSRPLGGERDVCTWRVRLGASVRHWRDQSSEANVRIGE